MLENSWRVWSTNWLETKYKKVQRDLAWKVGEKQTQPSTANGKTLFLRDWFNKGILSIQDLLDDAGHILSYQEFNNKYSCKSNFLQYYQVISAIPKDLLNKAKLSDPIRKELYSSENFTVQLSESTQLFLNKAKTCDFYKLLNVKTHTAEHTGPRRWNENLAMHMNEES